MSDDEELVDYENVNPPLDKLLQLLNQNNEVEESWTSDEEEQENSINSTSDANQVNNPNENGINSQAVGNASLFSYPGIRNNRFPGPATNSGFVGQARNTWNNRFPVNNQGSDAVQPSANTPFSIAASRFRGPREFRGPSPGIVTSRPPVINMMNIIEANRPLSNIRTIRASLPNRPIVPGRFDVHSHRSPLDTKPVGKVNQNYFPQPCSKPIFQVGSRYIRPNVFPGAKLFSGGSRFATQAPESIAPMCQGMGMNLSPHSIGGVRIPFAAQDDRANLETKQATSLHKLPPLVSNNPSNEEEESEPEGDYEEGDDLSGSDQESQSQNEPPAVPPPRVPRPLPTRFPVASPHPRFAKNPIPIGYSAPRSNNAIRYQINVETGYHPNENIKPTVSEPNARASATDEDVDHNTQNEPLPSISSRTPSTSFQPSTRSSDITDHRTSTPSAESPQPPPLLPKLSQTLNIRPPAALAIGGRKISQEGVPSSNISDDTRGVRTITDLEGYEQIQGFGDGSSSSLMGPRIPTGARAARPCYTPPMMQKIRPKHNIRLPSTQMMLLALENGDLFESTPFYESILREDYFHLIGPQEAQKRLTHDGMFLFLPSSSRKDSNPLTLWLRYNGQNYKFSIKRRDDGKFSIGNVKEKEDRFYSIAEMVSHYFHMPLKFEGKLMCFEKPASKPM